MEEIIHIMAKIHISPSWRKPIIITAVLCAFIITGIHLLHISKAATPFLSIEAESGTVSKGATIVSDSQAAGGKATKFAAPTASVINGSVDADTDKYSLEFATYDPLTTLRSKGYTKMNIGQVADAAATTTKSCSIGAADTKLDWKNVSCMPFEDTGWRQQGIGGAGGSGWTGKRNDIIIVSWHSGNDKQARLTVMNLTTKKQTFVQLVQPCTGSKGYCDIASDSSQCSTVHAGSVTWYKNLLYSADSNCLITYNVDELYKLADGSYVLPAIGSWKRTSTAFTYSATSLDTSGTTPRMLVVEYVSGGCSKTRFGSWNLDPATGNLATASGKATSTAMYHVNDVCNAQGLDYQGGSYFLSTSGGGTITATATCRPHRPMPSSYHRQTPRRICIPTRRPARPGD
jgi:hypothetical protein